MVHNLTIHDVEHMLRSGYAVRTAQQFEFLSTADRIDLVREVSEIIRSRLPAVAASSLWFGDADRRQLMEDIVDQVRHMRYPSYLAINTLYRQMYGVDTMADDQGFVDIIEVIEMFRAGYQMQDRELFIKTLLEHQYRQGFAERLWTVIVAVRNGDIILPSVHELIK